MEYNSSRPLLTIPEYGRNVQKMVQFALNIEDRELRNQAANTIINVMAQTTTQPKDVSDFRHKLWNHLHVIAEFKLDVDCPYPVPDSEEIHAKHEKLAYSTGDIHFKHYGKTIEKMIEKAVEMEDGEMKDVLVNVIANHMKKAYIQWNKGFVNDEIIYKQLSFLAKGKLNIDETKRLFIPTESMLNPTTIVKKKNNSNNKIPMNNIRKKYRN